MGHSGKMILSKAFLPLFTLVMLFDVSATSFYKTFSAKKNQLFQIVQDPKTQDVYVGGRNKIYRFDSMLKLKQEVTVGPVEDSRDCLPRRKCPSKDLTNNDIVVLEIQPFSHNLFACGTVKQGACMMYDLSNIHNSTNFYATKAENFVGSNDSTIAFFSADPLTNTSILYVAISYDGRTYEAYPKTMSERIISKSTSGIYNLSYRKSYLIVPKGNDLLYSYPMKYFYGFKHQHFIYYVSLQGNRTYIGRVCEFSEFYYYVEIRLKCWHKKIVYNVATAAKLVPSEKGYLLYVAYWDEVNKKSHLCNHTLKSIRAEFTKTIDNCYRHKSDEKPTVPPWIQKNKPCIETYGYTLDLDSCGRDESNGYISGGAEVAISELMYDNKLTSIGWYKQDETYVYLLGTQNGHLLKIILENKLRLVMDVDVSQGSGQPIQKDMQFDTNRTHVYAISGSTLVRFPLNSCSVYTSCSTCVTTEDPLNCGWCHDKCTARSECSNGWSPDCCTPQITSINPTKGPVEGGTKLTIKGEYFSNNDPDIQINVKIGTAPCTVKKYNSTHIFCMTSKDTSVKKGNLHVKIRARSIANDQPKIEGEDRSTELFYFMIPEIYNFTPTYGPVSGGTKCNILGKNLDIGSTFNVYIKEQTVTVENRTQDMVIALTPEVNNLIVSRLKFQIDNQILWTKSSYNYKPNPIIESLESPKRSIKSGGIDIVFIGRYLNTVQNPMLSGVVVKTGNRLPPEKCIPNKSGTKLFCKTPRVNESSSESIPVDLHLLMDGVEELSKLAITRPEISRIYYQNDPILNKFASKNHIFLYSKTRKYLEIKGNYITDILQEKDINVTIGYQNCPIISLTNQIITCKPSSIPPENAEHQKFQVHVYIGYQTYDIGWLIFVSSSSAHVNVPIIVLAVIVSCILIIIAILFYCLRKKKLLFFKEKSSLPAARYTTNDQVHFGENGRLITPANEYTERQNFQPATTVNIGATSFPVIDEGTLLVLEDKKLLIPKEALQITDKIGQGHFGCVYRALYRKPGEKGEMLVAVKTLHKDHPRDMDVQGFLDEALIMKDFDHENILSLIGICLGKDHMPLVVLPYMAHGDLLSYLRNVDNQPTVKDLIIFGISISSGMEYLASLKFVHRDLAARNCMLNDKLVVKVADFGLSRDIYERDYYSSDNKKSKLPVKWMALESLENGTYNTKTDVWSYGVVLWELFTRGVNPYPTVDNWDMPKYLRLGRRMDKPDYCPNRIYDIMIRCWEFDQNLRPDFGMIVKELTELSEMEKHKDLPCYQKTPYANVDY